MNDTGLELINLEELLEDDCKCESDHVTNNTTCSESVCYLVRAACGRSGLVCYNAGLAAKKAVEYQLNACVYCGADLELCWTITPI